ncbi:MULTISPECIES: beta-galactosidase GalB [Chitinophagaceae]
MIVKRIYSYGIFIWAVSFFISVKIMAQQPKKTIGSRERISLDNDWKFMRYNGKGDSLIYDERPLITDYKDNKVADTKADISDKVTISKFVLKPWILPTANNFIQDTNKHYQRPPGNPGIDFPFVQNNYDDQDWQSIDLPHDWAIDQPFYKEQNAIVGGGMGRLPIQGVGWYRKKIAIPQSDKGKSIYLDIDGAMSYAMIWLNGYLVGGWPYGYNSFRLDLTPYIQYGKANQLAIRIDNPNNAARWYPGAGLYRNVWLVKANPIHVAQWGTFVTTKNISAKSATIDIALNMENSAKTEPIQIKTDIYLLKDANGLHRKKIKSAELQYATVISNKQTRVQIETTIDHPMLWQPLPSKEQSLYQAEVQLVKSNAVIDTYTTTFGIRDLQFDAARGILINGQSIKIQGVNQHSDLGALGMAFNYRAAERQLEILKELGCNAIRLSHNPPDPQLLDLTDKMGFLVIDEIFDCWEKGKTPLDFHLVFPEWHEADLRAFIRRDRNHPSIIEWSFGNEVGEQYTDSAGAVLAQTLRNIVHEEDSTRPATASMNYVKPNMPFAHAMDVLSLNYQGEGIRDAPAYAHLNGIHTPPLYPRFKDFFPNKMIQSSETASTLSTRSTYFFPVTDVISAPVSDSTGGDPMQKYVSSYDLYTAAFGASPDKVFAAQDHNPYVAGEFVWSGFDYIGEPTPYYTSRSSYSGIIDLAGFAKDRFYLYQSRWRPSLPMAHILPHWNWPERIGKITPVHVYSSGDEAELFLNGKSLGRKRRDSFQYRFRWDDVVYEPGELKVITYKHGRKWAANVVRTTGTPVKIHLIADRKTIKADGQDLCFITVQLEDNAGNIVPSTDKTIHFSIEGPGKIIATDNGDPSDLNSFSIPERKTLAGLALIVVRFNKGAKGSLKIKANARGITENIIQINSFSNNKHGRF